jgi:hypothetical protein
VPAALFDRRCVFADQRILACVNSTHYGFRECTTGDMEAGSAAPCRAGSSAAHRRGHAPLPMWPRTSCALWTTKSWRQSSPQKRCAATVTLRPTLGRATCCARFFTPRTRPAQHLGTASETRGPLRQPPTGHDRRLQLHHRTRMAALRWRQRPTWPSKPHSSPPTLRTSPFPPAIRNSSRRATSTTRRPGAVRGLLPQGLDLRTPHDLRARAVRTTSSASPPGRRAARIHAPSGSGTQ